MTTSTPEQPLITVVIPCYNVERYLDQCVASVCTQSYTNLEIILVDDGASDSTPAMCDAWGARDERIRVLHKENGGPSDSRNAAWDCATGEYVFFLDSDDYLVETAIETLLEIACTTKADLVLSGFHKVSEQGEILSTKTLPDKQGLHYKEFVDGLFKNSFVPSPWGKLFKSCAFSQLRYVKGMLFEDTYFWGDALRTGNDINIASTSAVTVFYRQSPGSVMKSYHGNKEREMVAAWSYVGDMAISRFPELRASANRRLCEAYFDLLDRACMAQETEANAVFNEAAEWLLTHEDIVVTPGNFSKGRCATYTLLKFNRPLYRVLRRFLNR